MIADLEKTIFTAWLRTQIVLQSLWGIIKAIRQRAWVLALLVPVIGFLLASVVVFAFARLSAPVLPYMIGLAIFGLWSIRRSASVERPIRVIQVITRLIVGGAQETVMYNAALLDQERFHVEVLAGPQTGSEGSLIEEVCARDIQLTILPDLLRQISPKHDLLALLKLTRQMRLKGYTIVHTNSSKAGILGRIAAWLAGVPLIVHTVHGWSFHEHMTSWQRRLYITLERLAASFTDALVVVTERDINKGLQNGIGRPDQYHLIRSAIPLDEFDPLQVNRNAAREELGIPLDAPVLGNVGRFSSQKNPLDWIQVAALVAEQMPACYFLLVGDGPLRSEVENLISKKGLSEVTILTGLRRDVAQMLSAIDVFLLTSLWEGLPRVIPQAMAMQVPVVANRVDGSAEAILPGITGYLCTPGDLHDLSEHCLKLLRDSNLRIEMGRQGRSYALDEFNVYRMVDQTMELYENLLTHFKL